ncbi:hypothetical protein C8R47DRAFT_1191109 [Mycena vitilis]|nr:hypothetical protein C8R47DRAFT_1191109 [Mycena vitilis]
MDIVPFLPPNHLPTSSTSRNAPGPEPGTETPFGFRPTAIPYVVLRRSSGSAAPQLPPTHPDASPKDQKRFGFGTQPNFFSSIDPQRPSDQCHQGRRRRLQSSHARDGDGRDFVFNRASPRLGSMRSVADGLCSGVKGSTCTLVMLRSQNERPQKGSKFKQTLLRKPPKSPTRNLGEGIAEIVRVSPERAAKLLRDSRISSPTAPQDSSKN